MIRYIVFIQDEWINNWLIGVYDNLSDAVPDINTFLESYDVSIDKLETYPSTFGECFDRFIETPDESGIFIRGFIWKDDLIKEV